MTVSSGQTAAQTQERGPKELHSAGPGRARPGRELCSVRFPLAPPPYSRHSNTNLASSLLDSAFWAGAARHPPRPRPARRALPQGSVAREVEDGKTIGGGGGLVSLPLGRSALRGLHRSPLSCVFAYGGRGGGTRLCEAL